MDGGGNIFTKLLQALGLGKQPASTPPADSGSIPTSTDAPIVPDALGGTAPSSVDTATTASVDTSGGTIVTETPTTPTDTVGAPTPIGLPPEAATAPAAPQPAASSPVTVDATKP